MSDPKSPPDASQAIPVGHQGGQPAKSGKGATLQAALRRSQDQYERLLATVDGIVWEADPSTFIFSFVSEQAERLLGYPCSNWIGDPDFWTTHLHPDDRESTVRFCKDSTDRGEDHDLEYRMVAADGRVVWLRDIVSVVTQPDGSTILRGIMVDATARRAREEEFRTTEERYRRFVENLNDVVYALDASGCFVYCSPAIEQVSSYTAAEVLGRPFTEFVDPEDLPQLMDAFSRSMTGKPVKVEYRVYDKNGDRRWVQASVGPTLENGEVVGVTGVFSDITSRKQTSEALLESEARYRELVEMSPDSIVVHRGGKIVFVNSAAIKLAGARDAGEMLGRSALDLVHETSRPLALERIRRMTQEGRPVARVEEQFLRLDGTTIDVEVLASPVLFHGQPAIQVIIHDATARKLAQEQIRRLTEDLEQRVRDRTAELVAANRELEAFSYSVSHDLRAPLRVIEGFARMFLQEYATSVDEQGLSYLERIHATSSRMDRLIHDLLAFSRMSRASMTWGTVDLSGLAHAAVGRLREVEPNRKIETVIADGLVVQGDEALLQIVMENLVGNAWKYTSTRPSARIEFGREAAGAGHAYFVRDDGVGFDMRFVDKLFRPFQRLHAIGEFEGTGIGLATVQRVIERHGGRVSAEGEMDGGATVRFTLPSPR